METNWLYLLSLLIILIITFKYSSNKRKLPPSPHPKLPLWGHLHLLKFPLHRTYHHLSTKLGPIFSLQLGSRHVVVVSSHTIVDECFTQNDVVLANRPRFIIGKYISYNYASLASAPYGDHWRNIRRLTTVEIFSNSRLNLFQSIRHDEVARMLDKVRGNSGRVELRPLLSELTFNNIMRMVCGKRYFGEDESNDEAKEFRELKDEVFARAGLSNPADFFPVFRWIDYKDFEKSIKRVHGRMDVFLQGLIDEHRRRKGGNTMIDHLLSLQQSEPESYTDVIIKSIIMVILIQLFTCFNSIHVFKV